MPAPEEATARRPGRWWVIALMVLGALALAAVIVEISTQRPGDEELTIVGINDAQRIFAGLPQIGDRLGESDAPVTIQVFNDLQCGDCEGDFLDTVPTLVDDFVRSGEAKLLYRHYSFSPRPVQEGFIAAEAAGRQGYQWQYAYLFFRNQEEAARRGVTADLLESIAASVGEIEIGEWEEDYLEGGRPDGSITRELEAQDEVARDLGLRAEPSWIVTGPGGTETLQDSPSLEEIEAAVARVG